MLIQFELILPYSFEAVANIRTAPRSQQFPQSHPVAFLTAEPQPASSGPDVGLQANQGPVPTITTNIVSTGKLQHHMHHFSLAVGEAEDKTRRRGWEKAKRRSGTAGFCESFRWKTNESCRGGAGEEDRNIWDREEGEAREDKWHKGFILLRLLWLHFWGWPCKCHVGILATNHSWSLPQSLWQSPARSGYLSKSLQLLLAEPSHHSRWCWTDCRNKVRNFRQLLFVMSNIFSAVTLT